MDLEVGGILGLIWLIIVIWAILKVAKSGAGTLAKVLWILILLFFICLSITFSLISLFPISKNDKLKKPNWLFFGDYNNTSYEDYTDHMIQIMKSEAKTYDTLLLEIYQSGVVLGNKFKFIRWSYTSLMSGFAIFLIMIFINKIILT